MRASNIVAAVVFVLSIATLAAAQSELRAGESPSPDVTGEWVPLGPIPVDQAGAGRRGYALAGESAEVPDPGADRISLHMVAANDFYREQTADLLISERYEAHTVALGYARGFRLGSFPRFEIGGQVQFTESDGGVLNGFIAGFEDVWVSLTGRQSAKNQLRTGDAVAPPLGTFVSRQGRPLYQAAGGASGIGDLSVTAKVLLRDALPASLATRVAARISLNVSGSSAFTEGNFAGAGVSVDKKLGERVAVHGDVRAQLLLDRVSQWGLPLRRATWGFSAGPELKIARNTSFGVQLDGSATPYLPTGAAAFDDDYGAVTFGLNHRFAAGRRRVVAQVYARENMNLPFRVRWNTDPDLAIGMKATIR